MTSGVPLQNGAVKKVDELVLRDAGGKPVPCQMDPVCRWPDGSLKWVHRIFQADLAAGATLNYTLARGKPAKVAGPLKVTETGDCIVIDTGAAKITISKKISEDGEDCVNICPRGVLEWDKKKKTINVIDLEACNLCMSCVETCETGAIEVDYDDTKFLMTFETDSSYTPEVVLKYAIDLLNRSFNDFIEAVGKLS